MTLEEVIRIVIPTPSGACRLVRMRLESERYQLRIRIEQKRDLDKVPKKTLEEIEKLFGALK